jgi:two-component system NtrC family sensor kinase
MKKAALLLLVLCVLIARNAHASRPVVTANDQSIGRTLHYLIDTAKGLTPQKALVADGYRPSLQDVPNLGISGSATWFKFTVPNTTNENQLTLAIPYAEIDQLHLYRISNGEPVLLGMRGQSTAQNREKGSGGEYVFELRIPPNDAQSFLLRVAGHKQMHVPLIIDTPIGISEHFLSRNILIGAFAGIMLVLVLYNLFVFISIRDKAYLVYVAYILINSFGQLTLMGSSQAFFWPSFPWLIVNASVILVLLSIGTGVMFTRRFISTKTHTPRLDRLAPVVYVAIAINLFVYLGVDKEIGYKMAQAISGCSSTYLLTISILASRTGSRPAHFFLLAWGFFLIGVMLFVMKDSGVIPYTNLSVYAMPIGSAIEGVLLSFGLADRINILRREKERSQAEALKASLENERIIREQNVMLEEKVTERTHALQESNDHLKRTQSQLVNAEKMASLGQLTAGIAHEINNPVNFITSNIPPLRRNLGEVLEVLDDYRKAGTTADAQALNAAAAKEKKLGLDESIEELGEILGSIQEGAHRTAEIVRGLRNFSRLDEDDLKPADINDCLRSTLTVLGPQFRDTVTLDLQFGTIPKVECFAGKLNQVFMNMLNNAAQAVKQKHPAGLGRVTIGTALVDGLVVVSIRDNGVGMTDSVKARIYEPFFTTKDVGEGTGLGLSIAYSIVEKHHGTIAIDSVPGEGSEFRIMLPLEQPHTNELNAQRA